jgi:hypothetical protein
MEKGTRGRPSGGGSKLQRTETVTLRLDPKLRYLTELAARIQRRTVSSFIEWAVEQALSRVNLPDLTQGEISIESAASILWDPDEADRLARLGFYYPELLTYDEQVLWKLIQECEALWRRSFNHRMSLPWYERETMLLYPALRQHWEALKKVAAGEADRSILPPAPARQEEDAPQLRTVDTLPPTF